ncbi:MAG: hypothetical protein AABY22_26265 [Nanoarchaeota archaeon]
MSKITFDPKNIIKDIRTKVYDGKITIPSEIRKAFGIISEKDNNNYNEDKFEVVWNVNDKSMEIILNLVEVD